MQQKKKKKKTKNKKDLKKTQKKTRRDTNICRFLQGIWLYTQREDGANTSSLWST